MQDSEALAPWRHLVTHAEDGAAAQAELSESEPRHIPAILYPTTLREVQDIVEAARANGTPLYPVSTGMNWGLGSRHPVRDGCVLVDLRRLDRLRDLNLAHGYAVIEAGVSQHVRQLEQRLGCELLDRSTRPALPTASGRRLLIAASTSPRELPVKLADLKSRLTLALIFQMRPLSDEDKLRALQLRASRRGLHLTDEVGHFILTRGTRSMSALFDLLEQLDQASLQAQRKLTIPFLKETLGW